MAAGCAIVALAIVVRFPDVGARTVHWDEGVHAYWSWNLLVTGSYSYDPVVHGPLLYYLSAAFMGPTDVSVAGGRTIVAAATLLAFPALYLLRDDLPRSALLFAGAALAVQPYVVATARFYRNDALLATLCLLGIGIYARYRRTPSFASAAALGGVLGLAVGTKEAVYLLVPAIALPVVVLAIRAAVVDGPRAALDRYAPLPSILVAIVVFEATVIALYGGWPPRPLEAMPTLVDGIEHWIERGETGSPNATYYLDRLIGELPLLSALAAVGAVGAIRRPGASWVRWTLLSWAVLVGVPLSLISDQSWWNAVLLVVPVVVLAGTGAADLRALVPVEGPTRPAVAAAAPVLAGVLVVATTIAVGGVPTDVAKHDRTGTDDRERAFLTARERATAADCAVVIGPGTDPWPGHWWLRDVRTVGFEDWQRNRSAVVISKEPIPGGLPSSYDRIDRSEWRIHVPEAGC